MKRFLNRTRQIKRQKRGEKRERESIILGDVKESKRVKRTSSEVRRRTSLIVKKWENADCCWGVPLKRVCPRGPGSKKTQVPTSTAYCRAEVSMWGESSSKP